METAQGTRLERHGVCILARGGIPWPSDLSPSSGSVLVGYRHDYAQDVLCEEHFTYETRGRASFDLIGQSGPVERAELSFSIRPPGRVSNTCLGARMTYRIDAVAPWDRPGIISEPDGTGRAIGGYPRPASVSAGPSRADQVTVDVTAQVNAWLDGYPNRGFEIAPIMGRPTIGTDSNCFVEAYNFGLILELP